MPTDLQFDYESGCLIVRASGPYFLEQKEAAIKAIAAAIKAQPVKAVLVDLRAVPGHPTFMDRYQLGELAGRYLTHGPIAVLAHEKQTDPQRIGKIVANNRGAKVEIVTDLVEAEKWLKKYIGPDQLAGATGILSRVR